MKSYLKSVAALTAICAVVALLLSGANLLTSPIISKSEASAADQAMQVVLPGGEDFQPVDLSGYTLPATVQEAYREKNGGYVIKLETAGYSAGMVIMCGVDAAGAVTGAVCLSSSETLGYEETYGESTVGATAQTIDQVNTVSGATKTTGGYRAAVKDALNTALILGGESVDTRSEEEILADRLAEALPAAEGKFLPLFITEELPDITAMYTAQNGAGAVCVAGEQMIAVDNAGNVLSDLPEAEKEKIGAQAEKMLASQMKEIDLSGYSDMPSQVRKAYRTTGGCYVFELRAAGFGINGDSWYQPSGEYIYLKVSATPAGKIIACETLSQKESEGIGSACADASFYTQFNGKEKENYGEIDGITGATITTNGYKTAVSKVFEAIRILRGEA